uniref:Uncharacterized protein n=1 Tax=Romanomermis culicivorax TaxID=13658 RepID=A0A915L3Z5_ROMCU
MISGKNYIADNLLIMDTNSANHLNANNTIAEKSMSNTSIISNNTIIPGEGLGQTSSSSYTNKPTVVSTVSSRDDESDTTNERASFLVMAEDTEVHSYSNTGISNQNQCSIDLEFSKRNVVNGNVQTKRLIKLDQVIMDTDAQAYCKFQNTSMLLKDNYDDDNYGYNADNDQHANDFHRYDNLQAQISQLTENQTTLLTQNQSDSKRRLACASVKLRNSKVGGMLMQSQDLQEFQKWQDKRLGHRRNIVQSSSDRMVSNDDKEKIEEIEIKTLAW